jgi:hypothetical protein
MLISWKKTGPIEFVARAWGMNLNLQWLPQEQRWAVTVDGARCRQRWASAVAAIDECDAVAARCLASLAVKGRPTHANVPLDLVARAAGLARRPATAAVVRMAVARA